MRGALQIPFGLYTVVNLFYIFNNQRQAVCLCVCVCVCVRERSVCIYLICKILSAAIYLGISIQHLSEGSDDTATCSDNSTISPLANLIH